MFESNTPAGQALDKATNEAMTNLDKTLDRILENAQNMTFDFVIPDFLTDITVQTEKERCDKILRNTRIECAIIVGTCWTIAAIDFFVKRRRNKR